MIELTLYTRAGCHLCEEMLADLAPLQVELGFRTTPIEVGWEGPLAERYGKLLPVLCMDRQEICHYFLDVDALRGALRPEGGSMR